MQSSLNRCSVSHLKRTYRVFHEHTIEERQKTQRNEIVIIDRKRIFSLVSQRCRTRATSRNTARNGGHPEDSKRTRNHATEFRRHNVNLFVTPKTNEQRRQRGKPQNKHTQLCTKLLKQQERTTPSSNGTHVQHANFVESTVTKQHHQNCQNEPQRPNAKTKSKEND